MLRIGIIGCGGIARAHIKGLRGAGCEVVVGVDISEVQREKAKAELGLQRLYETWQQMLESEVLDAVAICTPNYVHAQPTLDALEAGLHVLCTKPMAMNAIESRAMVEAAARNDKLLMMSFNQRFDPGIARMVQLYEQGFFGETYHARTTQLRQAGTPGGVDNWFTDRARAGWGVSGDLGSHCLYRAWYPFGKPKPVSVSGKLYAKIETDDLDDMTTGLIRFEGEKTMLLETAWAALRPDQGKRTTVHGTHGGAFYHTEQNLLVLVERTDSGPKQYEEKLDPPDGPDRFSHFVECVEEGIACQCPGEDGHCNQAIIDALAESSKSGKDEPVRL